MKKTISLLVTLALGCVSAFAQEAGYFNHLSVGVGLLGTDGNGIYVASPIGNFFQVRAGFSTQAINFLGVDAATKSIDEVGSIKPFKKTVDVNIQQGDLKIDQVDIEARPSSNNLELMFDLYPGEKTGFHFTIGSYISLSKSLFNATAAPKRKDGKPVFATDPRNTEFYDAFSANADGKFVLDLKWGSRVFRPYMGIGFGRPVSLKHRVGVNFDMGVAYVGGAQLVTYSWFDDANRDNPKATTLDADFIDKHILNNPDASEDFKKNAKDIKKYVETADKYSQLYPILKLSIFVRLF